MKSRVPGLDRSVTHKGRRAVVPDVDRVVPGSAPLEAFGPRQSTAGTGRLLFGQCRAAAGPVSCLPVRTRLGIRSHGSPSESIQSQEQGMKLTSPVSRRNFLSLAAGQLALGVAPVHSQWRDSRPLRIVVPFSAGSQTDVIARLMSPLISDRLKQVVIVEDRPGASGILGAEAVLAEPPNGNNLLFVSGAYAVLPVSGLKLPYDPAKDLEAVSIVARSPLVLVASKATGFRSLSDLVKAGKKKPGALTFASSGVGSSTHLNAEYFAHAAGFKALHIPMKGGPDMLNEILASRVDFAFLPPSDLIGFGPDRVTQLGVTGRQRVPLAPAAPPIAESGLPGFEYFLWQALLVKANADTGRLADLHASIIHAVEDAEVTKRFHDLGIEALKLDLKGSREFIAQQLASTAELVKACNLKLSG